MESIYYVMCFACHRRCKHCYEDRFRPYVRDKLAAVVAEAKANYARIIDHFPDRMTYLDLADPAEDGTLPEKTGRVILSGGEALLDPLRAEVTYKVVERLTAKYARHGGVKIVVQTTGDLLDECTVTGLLQRGVYMISVAGVDDYHVGMEGPEKQRRFMDDLTRLFEAAGMKRSGLAHTERQWHEEEGPLFNFFGATDDSWIGKLWPRGRAWTNSLSRATLADNFCDRWVGRAQFPPPPLQRLRGFRRADRRRIPVLHQDTATDWKPCRRAAHRDPRFAGGGARVRSDFDRSSRAHGPRLRLEHRGLPRAFEDTQTGWQALCQSLHRLRRVPRGDAGAGDRSRAQPPSRRLCRSG